MFKFFADGNDYPLQFWKRVIRTSAFRSGLTAKLGPKLWKPAPDTSVRLAHAREVDVLRDFPIAFDDPEFTAVNAEQRAIWNPFKERHWVVENGLVEPNRCHVIDHQGRLVTQSNKSPFIPLYPDRLGYHRRKVSRRFDEAIVYDGKQSTNYFHHLLDCVGTLPYAFSTLGIGEDVPLIVNRWIYDSRFFADLRARSPRFASLNWQVLEPGMWASAGILHILRNAQFDPSTMAATRAFYPAVSQNRDRRIFLSRDRSKFSRGLINEAEVEALLMKHGFETVYAENLSIPEQQKVFEECGVLVGLHGMGMVQMIFMNPRNARILELMPKDRIHPEYAWQSWGLGHQYYDALVGSERVRGGNYAIDMARFERAVSRLLAM